MRIFNKFASSIVMLAAAGTPLLRAQTPKLQEEMVINGVKFEVADFGFGSLNPTQVAPDSAPPVPDEFTVMLPNKLSQVQIQALNSLKADAHHSPSFHPSPVLIVIHQANTEYIYTFATPTLVGETYTGSDIETGITFTSFSENEFQVPSPTNPPPCFDNSTCTGPS